MNFRVSTIAAACCLLASAFGAAPAAAQDQLRVFLDCSYFCDTDYIRTELNWVDHMRDRADADVHVLVARQSTGGGGAAYTLEFIGLRDFAGRADTLRYVSTSEDTPDVVRRGMTQTLRLGLIPFVAQTPVGSQLQITRVAAPAPSGDAPAVAESTRDPWNFWTFTVSMSGNSNGESQQQSTSLSSSATANRTTEDWKLNFRVSGSYNESSFDIPSGDSVIQRTALRRSYNANSLIVKSISPHMSIGGRASASTSTYGNNDLSLTFAPAIEYNYFPYSESTRRSLVMQYSAGLRHADYNEITLYDQLEETRPVHTLAVGYSTQQPWGSVNVDIDGAQYLHDTSKYSAGLSGNTSLRVFRGLSFNMGGSYRRVHDELSIPRRSLSESEVLLRQRQLATNYRYFMHMGLSYRFGSIFNNVVNPRFGGGGGGGMIIMM